MKKYILFLVGFFHFSPLYANTQLGIQLEPGFTFSSIKAKSANSTTVGSGGTSGKFQAGLVVDHPFLRDNYYFSTGVFYLAQRLMVRNNNQSVPYELNQLQVPTLFKIYTNEVDLDVRIYAKLGPVFSLNFNGFLSDDADDALIKKTNILGTGGLLGAGIEWETGLSTSLFIGLSYQQSIFSLVQESSSIDRGYGNLLSLELGFRA